MFNLQLRYVILQTSTAVEVVVVHFFLTYISHISIVPSVESKIQNHAIDENAQQIKYLDAIKKNF